MRLLEARPAGGGLYTAEIEVVDEERGRSYRVHAERLVREPASLEARVEAGSLLIHLRDRDGAPVATCCIHLSHLERGCMECRSLLLPARGAANA